MSKAKRWHGIGDESKKGGASMFLSGMKGEFETADGLESHNALLDVKFVLNQVTRVLSCILLHLCDELMLICANLSCPLLLSLICSLQERKPTQ
jgi:hypothetical protein